MIRPQHCAPPYRISRCLYLGVSSSTKTIDSTAFHLSHIMTSFWKSGTTGIGSWNARIALNLAGTSEAVLAGTPAKFKSYWKSLSTDLTLSSLCESFTPQFLKEANLLNTMLESSDKMGPNCHFCCCNQTEGSLRTPFGTIDISSLAAESFHSPLNMWIIK